MLMQRLFGTKRHLGNPGIPGTPGSARSTEPLSNRGILDAFVRKALDKATAHKLAAENYDSWARILKAPSTICLVALVSVTGFAEVTGTEVMNLILLTLTILAAISRALETMFNFEARSVAHAACADKLEEFADTVLLTSRRARVTEETTTKVVRQWHRLKCVSVGVSYEHKAAKMQDENHAWLDELKRRHSLSESQNRKEAQSLREPTVTLRDREVTVREPTTLVVPTLSNTVTNATVTGGTSSAQLSLQPTCPGTPQLQVRIEK